jgi:hypothetical protein
MIVVAYEEPEFGVLEHIDDDGNVVLLLFRESRFVERYRIYYLFAAAAAAANAGCV